MAPNGPPLPVVLAQFNVLFESRVRFVEATFMSFRKSLKSASNYGFS